MFEERKDSEVANIEYFRKYARAYALPALTRNKNAYVTVKTYPEDSTQESYSVLIKKDVYKKSSFDELAEACSKYTDYLPTMMEVTELLETNGDGGKFRFTTLDKTQFDKWMDLGSSVVYARSEESLERERQTDKEQKRIEKEFKEGEIEKAQIQQRRSNSELKGFSLDMIEKM
jgi:NDP-sugar pyrophosphorylase family protein